MVPAIRRTSVLSESWLAVNAYALITRFWRGVISASPPTVTPRYTDAPKKSSRLIADKVPISTEKTPLVRGTLF